MGYNTWNDFRCNINETDVKTVIKAFQKYNLAKFGYKYINIDDCYAVGRHANGSIIVDPKNWPNGMEAVADMVHKAGYQFGVYTDRGTKTCDGRPGSLGYEKIDAATYASWGVDYLKEDSCYASGDHNVAFAEYAAMRDALNATGRPILFSLCGWNFWYAPMGRILGNSWRIAGDINTWPNLQNAVDINAQLSYYAQPGAFNDPDMLVGSTPGSAAILTQDQSRTQFSLWAITASPLLIGANIVHLSAWDLATYTNSEVIAVNQDPMGKQGIRLAGGNLTSGAPFNVWGRPLVTGDWAVLFLNNSPNTRDITCDVDCFVAMGLGKVQVRDLWQHKVVGTAEGSWTAKGVLGKGASVIVTFTRTN